MDHRSVLNDLAESFSSSISVDQAIFTSIRSPMGEGYRLVAATPGIRAEEKAEITRRAPSHGSLCNEKEDALGFLAYPLSGGRFCVAHSQCAGKEHTGRGGLRIYTHFVVLDKAAYDCFSGNPLTVFASVHHAINGKPQLNPPTTLDSFSLRAPSADQPGPLITAVRCKAHPASDLVEKQLHDFFCRAILDKQSWLICSSETNWRLLHELSIALPRSVRRNLALSAGLKFAPSRQLSVCFTSGDPAEAQRAIRGQAMKWLDQQTLSKGAKSEFEPWVELTSKWLDAGRVSDVEHLTDAIDEPVSANYLTRIVELCRMIETIGAANADQTKALSCRMMDIEPKAKVEQRLHAQLREGVQHRLAHWERELASASAK